MSIKTIKLSECCVSISDGDHQPPPKTDCGIPFITISNVTEQNEIDFSDCMYVSEDYYSKLSDTRKARTGDILYTVVGSFGIPVLIRNDNRFVFQRHIAILRPNTNIVLPEYLYYILRTPSFYRIADAYAIGTAQRTIGLNSLRRIKVEIPSLSEQRKVVDYMSAFDNAIQKNSLRIKILEQMAEMLYKEWFVRFRFPGHEGVEFDGDLPSGWKKQRLEDFGITLETGSRPSGGIDDSIIDGVPSLGAEAVNGLAEFDYNSVRYIPHEYFNNLKRGRNQGNHVLVYKDGAYIGKVTIFRNEFPFKEYAVNEHVFLMNAKNMMFQNYLYFTLHQKEYFTMMQNLNRNAAQPGLSKPDIKRIRIIVPDIDTIELFNKLIDPIFDEVFLCAKKNRELIKQRDLLLPRLMSGKLLIK